MNSTRPFTYREKILTVIIALMIAIQLTGWQPSQAASNQLTRYQDEQLYDKAEQYSQEGNIVTATAYLYAYIQRSPPQYKNNIGGYRDKIDKVFTEWMSLALDYQAYAREAGRHIANCNQYPCRDDESEVTAMFARGFPPKMVMVCENINYKGKCSYLPLGEYTRWQDLGVRNDSISSVQVGSDVQVMLCVHYLDLPGDCLTVTGNNSNLNNSRLPGKTYTLNDNISTARVTFRPGKGLTLP
jgi:hypothetical protein